MLVDRQRQDHLVNLHEDQAFTDGLLLMVVQYGERRQDRPSVQPKILDLHPEPPHGKSQGVLRVPVSCLSGGFLDVFACRVIELAQSGLPNIDLDHAAPSTLRRSVETSIPGWPLLKDRIGEFAVIPLALSRRSRSGA
jgi:hypothetical protein